VPKWTTKEFIDDALGARNIVALTNLICDDDLPPKFGNTLRTLLTDF
jgi:hypothetical protein